MSVEICSNCGRVLLSSEQAYIVKGKIVCAECDRALRSKQAPQPTSLPKPTASEPFSPSLTPAQTTMNKKRTGGMTAIAVINFVFGGIDALSCLGGLVVVNSIMSNSIMTLANGGRIGMILLVTSLARLPRAGAAIVAGIGVLKLAPWGRTWTLVYAILGVLVAFIGWLVDLGLPNQNQDSRLGLALGAVISCIYPAILLYVINTKRWKETFGKSASQLANAIPNQSSVITAWPDA